jgi:hypothetical protein
MKKYILLLSAVLLVSSVSFAAENMGARPIGMGGAFVAVADDANAIFENPAGIGSLRGEHAIISNKISDGQYTIIAGVEETPIGNLGVGYISTSAVIDGATSPTANDIGDTPVGTQSQTLVVSLARELNRFSTVSKFMGKCSVGASVKVSNSLIDKAKGLSERSGPYVDADIAAIITPRDELSFGIAAKNLVSGISEDGEDSFEIAVGLSGKLIDKTITWSLSNNSVGCEWKPISLIALRVGKDGEYNTAGFGISNDGFGVDYAYRGEVNPVHYVGITITIDKQPDRKVAEVDKI